MASPLSPRPALISDALAAALGPQREKRAREILADFPSKAVQWAKAHYGREITVPSPIWSVGAECKVGGWLASFPAKKPEEVIDGLRRDWYLDLRWRGSTAEIVALPPHPTTRRHALEKAAAEDLNLARREADEEYSQRIEQVARKYPVTCRLKTDADTGEIEEWARDQVEMFRVLARWNNGADAVEWGCTQLGLGVMGLPGVMSKLRAAKAPDSLAVEIAAEKMQDARWWQRAARKQLRKARGWAWATLAPRAIQEGASSEALRDSREQDAAGEAWARDWQAVNEATGETVVMTGPEQARKRQYAEVLATAVGIGELADIAGEVPYLVTVTCPERMHPTTTHGGPRRRINGDYDGTSTEEALAWFRSSWAKARAAMGRAGLGKHWMRALEPHEDGTPHFHIIFWIDPTREQELSDTIRRYFEAGATASAARQAHGIQIKKVEGGTQGAIAYLATYISKGTAGMAGEEGTAERYRAWRRTYGARAFAFSHRKATLWRTLRKVKVDQTDDAWRAQEAAKAGQFALFWAEAGAAGLALWKETETEEDIGGGYRVERQRVRGVVDKAGQVYLADRYRLEHKPKPADLTNTSDSHLCVQLLSKNQGGARERVQELRKKASSTPASKLRERLHHTALPNKPISEKIRDQKGRNTRRGGEGFTRLLEKLGKMEAARITAVAQALGWMRWVILDCIWELDPLF